jgi:hypothetical protein
MTLGGCLVVARRESRARIDAWHHKEPNDEGACSAQKSDIAQRVWRRHRFAHLGYTPPTRPPATVGRGRGFHTWESIAHPNEGQNWVPIRAFLLFSLDCCPPKANFRIDSRLFDDDTRQTGGDLVHPRLSTWVGTQSVVVEDDSVESDFSDWLSDLVSVSFFPGRAVDERLRLSVT